MTGIDYSDLYFQQKVGQGSFGKVWRGEYLGTPVAIKECLKEMDDMHFEKYFEREVTMLTQARHPNIVQYLGVCITESKHLIVTEFIPLGTLKSWIFHHSEKSIQTRISFAIDIARALTYLHHMKIIHRDLKPSNLMITENLRIKVCDFGLSRVLAQTEEEKKRLSYCGTNEYMAPEIRRGEDFDQSIDVFGFGVILAELASCRLAGANGPFARQQPTFGLNPKEVELLATDDCPRHLIDLIIWCTDLSPNERPTMRQVLRVLQDIESNLDNTDHIGMVAPELASPVLQNTLDPDGVNQTVIPHSPGDEQWNNDFYKKLLDINIPNAQLNVRYSTSFFTPNDTSTDSMETHAVSTIKSFQTAYGSSALDESSILPTSLTSPNAIQSKVTFSSQKDVTPTMAELSLPITDTIVVHRFTLTKIEGQLKCFVCHEIINQYYTFYRCMLCDDCGNVCHKRCSWKAPANCVKKQSPALASLSKIIATNPGIDKKPFSIPPN